MKHDSKDNKRINYSLKYKLPMIILVIGYISYFIYQVFTKDFDINSNGNLVKIILIFVSVFLLGCATITNNKISMFFSFANYIIILLLILPVLPKNINKDLKNTSSNSKEANMICNGSSETSDNTTIDINYKKDDINKLVYTYTFDASNKTGAENLVNRFDKKYEKFENIYSEITISDNVVVTFTYNFDNIDKNELKNTDDSLTTSFKKFEKTELKNMTCNEK